MKNIIIMCIVAIICLTGCSSTEINSLEDFYGQLISKAFKNISMEKVKTDLKEFEYEYKLQEYSKEEKLELGLSDYLRMIMVVF